MNRAKSHSNETFDKIPRQNTEEARDEYRNKRDGTILIDQSRKRYVENAGNQMKESREPNESLNQEDAAERRGTPNSTKLRDRNISELSLLASPTASFDGSTTMHQEGQGENAFSTPEHNQHDDASFLLEHSFDSISQTTDLDGAAFQGIDISLPTLVHTNQMNISPIKLGQEEVRPTKDLVETLMFHYPETSLGLHESSIHRPYGYAQDRYDITTNYSNPCYVLRSSSRAFRQCTFLLSYIEKTHPIPIHSSISGAFNHYQNHDNLDNEVSIPYHEYLMK